MPRKPIEDIVPSGRSIRNIPISDVRPRARVQRPKPSVKAALEQEREQDSSNQEPQRIEDRFEDRAERARQSPLPPPPPAVPDQDTIRSVRQEFASHGDYTDRPTRISNGKRKKVLGISALILVVLILTVVISNIFYSATITVTPRVAEAALEENLVAQKSSASSTASASSLSTLVFKPVTLSQVGSSKVAAAGEEKVNKAATGTIIIYNNYNATAQRLVKNTRFETPEGLIYRITDSVTVPGKKGTTPGSVEAVVTADATGEKYNVGLKDFTIPGFKGDPRFNTFYARSKTPLQGGFVGTVKVVVDADRLKAQTDIKTKATVDLLQQLAAQKTADQVFFDNAYTVDCSPLPQETLSEKEVLIKMECSLTAAIFDIQHLSAYLASTKRISGFNSGDEVAINNLSDIAFKPKTPFAPSSADSVSFTLSGKATFVWQYDEAAFKQALAGKPKSDAPTILRDFPMIQKADVSIRPIWRRSFPADVKDITILTDLAS